MSELVLLHSIKTKPSDEQPFISSRRLSRHIPITMDTNYVDVYYRESPVSVPFVWESQPGTPKIKSWGSPVPPLTPPPAFHLSLGKSSKKVSKSNLKKDRLTESNQHRVSSPPRMSFDSGVEVEDECESPVSTFCFCAGRSTTGGRYRRRSLSIIK